jgi:hypothetical protein
MLFLIGLKEDCMMPKYEDKYDKGILLASVGNFVNSDNSLRFVWPVKETPITACLFR